MATKIQLRRDYAANWQATNPVLSLGEPGVELDTHLMKVGDGATAWNDLAYIQNSGDTDLLTEKMFIKLNGTQGDGVSNWAGTISVSNDGLNWTPATFNKQFTENQRWDTYALAVGGGRIVYMTYEYAGISNHSTERYELRFAHNPFEQPQKPTSDNVRRGPHGEDINWWKVRYVNGYFVAVGSYADSIRSDYRYPVAVYSADGDVWTNINVDLDYAHTLIQAERDAHSNDVTGLAIGDVAYGTDGWLFAMHWDYDSTSITRNPAGAFYITSITAALNVSSRIAQIPGTYVAAFDGHGWMAWANYDANTGGPAAYFNSNSDPRVGSWRTVDLREQFMAINGNNFYNCLQDVAAGKIGDTNWILIADGHWGVYATSDQGLTWKILQTTPELLAINHVNDTTPVEISAWEYGSQPQTGEKVTIEGSNVPELNGTFHVKHESGVFKLYHDVGLTEPVASVGAHDLYVDVSVTGTYGDHTVVVDDASNLVVGMISEGYNNLTSWEADNTSNDYRANVNKIVSINGNNVTMKYPWHGANGASAMIGFQAAMYRAYGDGIDNICYGDGAFIGFSYNNLERAYKTTDLETWQSTTQGLAAQNLYIQNTNRPFSVAYGTVTSHGALMRSHSNTVPGYTNFLSVSDTFQLSLVNGDPQWTDDNLSSAEGFGYGKMTIDPSFSQWVIGASLGGNEGFYNGNYTTAINTYNDGEGYNDGNLSHNSVSIRGYDYYWNFENSSGYFYSQRLSVGDGEGYDNTINGDSVIQGIYFYADSTNASHSDAQNVERGIYVNNGSLLIDAAYGTGGNGYVQIGFDDDTNYTKVDKYGTTISTEGYQWNFTDDCNDQDWGVLYQPDSALIQTGGYWKIGDFQGNWSDHSYIMGYDYYTGPGDIKLHAGQDLDNVNHNFYFTRWGELDMDYDGYVQSTGYWRMGDGEGSDSYTYVGATDNIDSNAYDIEVAANNVYWYFNRDGNFQLPPGGDIVDHDYVSVLSREMAQTLVTSGNYTLQLGDRGKHIYNTGTGDVLIPTNSVAFPVGTVITLISGDNAFHLSAVNGGTTTIKLSNSGTTTSINIPADTYTTILKIETEKWIVERAS
jgi:Major tropism determinant N-terminal domain